MKEKFYGHPRFPEIADELKELHSRKNYQYATVDDPLGNFRRCGILCSKLLKPENKALATCLVYMGKQVDAVIEMVGERKTNTIESLIDKLKDIATYSIIAIILIEEAERAQDDIGRAVKSCTHTEVMSEDKAKVLDKLIKDGLVKIKNHKLIVTDKFVKEIDAEMKRCDNIKGQLKVIRNGHKRAK